jgi:hypothetical protein
VNAPDQGDVATVEKRGRGRSLGSKDSDNWRGLALESGRIISQFIS